MEAKHTPGPWRIRPGFDGVQAAPRGEQEFGDMIVYGFARPKSASTLANARLIAAAPDLYVALLNCREYLPSGSKHLQTLDAAIAKAEGRDA